MRQVCLSACSCLPLLPQRHSPTCLWGCLGGGWVENPPFSTEAAELGTWEVLMSVGMPRSCPNASVRGQGARSYLVGPVSQLENVPVPYTPSRYKDKENGGGLCKLAF